MTADHRTLRRVTIELQPDGTWMLTREHASNGERFECDDLMEAFDVVLAAYRPDGTPRRKAA